MKNFLEDLNKMIAPATKAWKDYEIMEVVVKPSGYIAGPNDTKELVIDVKIKLTSQEPEPFDTKQIENVKRVFEGLRQGKTK